MEKNTRGATRIGTQPLEYWSSQLHKRKAIAGVGGVGGWHCSSEMHAVVLAVAPLLE